MAFKRALDGYLGQVMIALMNVLKEENIPRLVVVWELKDLSDDEREMLTSMASKAKLYVKVEAK